jgi:hypothetical protein
VSETDRLRATQDAAARPALDRHRARSAAGETRWDVDQFGVDVQTVSPLATFGGETIIQIEKDWEARDD